MTARDAVGSIPPPPPPPSPYDAAEGTYYLLTGKQPSPRPTPVAGSYYVGHGRGGAYGATWSRSMHLAFVGGDLPLGQVYFVVTAPRTQATPTAYVWMWVQGSDWAYLGELPVFGFR